MSALMLPGQSSTLRRDLGLVGRQIRYEQRAYWRNRGRGVFTFAFPLMFLVIFASLDRNGHIASLGGIPYDDFLVPGILAYGVIMTTFTNLAMTTTSDMTMTPKRTAAVSSDARIIVAPMYINCH